MRKTNEIKGKKYRWWAREDSNLQPDRYERMVYYAFDLLHLDGFDTRVAPLVERKRPD
jgi:ATP-dependent DNA ligase